MKRYPQRWKTDGNQRVRLWIAATLRRWRRERREQQQTQEKAKEAGVMN